MKLIAALRTLIEWFENPKWINEKITGFAYDNMSIHSSLFFREPFVWGISIVRP